MTFYHVIAKIGSEDKFRALFSDLSTAMLQERFVAPYERGKSFFCGNDLISPSDIRSLQIVQTQRLDQEERDEINRIDRAMLDEVNSSGGVFFISVGGGYEPQDIAQAGQDVTHTFIKGAPGFRSGRWAPSIKALGWFAGIIATVAAAGAVKWLGWV